MRQRFTPSRRPGLRRLGERIACDDDCIVVKEGKNVELLAESGKPLTRFFTAIVANVSRLKQKRFAIDGELVIADGKTFVFDALQARLHEVH